MCGLSVQTKKQSKLRVCFIVYPAGIGNTHCLQDQRSSRESSNGIFSFPLSVSSGCCEKFQILHTVNKITKTLVSGAVRGNETPDFLSYVEFGSQEAHHNSNHWVQHAKKTTGNKQQSTTIQEGTLHKNKDTKKNLKKVS